MKEPVEPSKEDCCSSGCNPCIFDVYEKQLILYRKSKGDEGDIPKTLIENAISQLQYTQFIVISNVQVCEAHNLLIFQAKFINGNMKVHWRPGDHFLVKYTTGDFTCSRAYTPLKQKEQNGSDFSVIVKRYSKGVVSQYLCNLKPGQETLWRGPYGSYENTPNKFHRIIMIAQGTGLAPFFSIIESILNNEDALTRLILLYCCHDKESILFREDLYSWKDYWNFTYKIYINHNNKNDVYKYREPVVSFRLDINQLLEFKPFSAEDQILLCGSNQFMNYYKKFLKMENVINVCLF